MHRIVTITIITILSVLIFGCKQDISSDSDEATRKCQELCKKHLQLDFDISKGPCLAEEIIPDWVCDVSLSSVDDEDEMCQNLRNKKANHFIEVDTECNLLKIY